jgi:uncharacterized small protein (DUF1192 family)
MLNYYLFFIIGGFFMVSRNGVEYNSFKDLLAAIKTEYGRFESNVEDLVKSYVPEQVFIRDDQEYSGFKAYIKGIKKDIRRLNGLKSKVEAIKAEALTDGNYGVNGLDANIANYQSRIDDLQALLAKQTAIKTAEAKVIIDGINADTYKGCVYELAKTFDGVFKSSDLYVFGEALAAKYPNFARSGPYGDNIENNIRGALSVLNNKDGLVEGLPNNMYRVANKATSKAVIYEVAG